MKKKILRILNRFNVGGPTYNVAFLTRYISNDFETKLIAGKKLDSEGSSEYILKEHTVDYEIIENMQRELSLVKDFKAFIEIRRIISDVRKPVNPNILIKTNPVAHNIMDILELVGVLSHSPTFDAFKEQRLIS